MQPQPKHRCLRITRRRSRTSPRPKPTLTCSKASQRPPKSSSRKAPSRDAISIPPQQRSCRPRPPTTSHPSTWRPKKPSHAKPRSKAPKGQLLSAQGKYQGAQAGVSYSEIRSPIDGVVTERPLFAGEIAATGQPLVTVMDVSSLLAKTHLAQRQAQQMQVGDEAEVAVPGSNEPLKGKVTLISPALDPGSTTVEIWVKVPNRGGVLRAGTPVKVPYRDEDHSGCPRGAHRRHRDRRSRQQAGNGHRPRQHRPPSERRTRASRRTTRPRSSKACRLASR